MTDPPELAASIAEFPNGRRKFEGYLLSGECTARGGGIGPTPRCCAPARSTAGRQVGVGRTYDRSGTVVKETAFADA